jgi:hypothetical protein
MPEKRVRVISWGVLHLYLSTASGGSENLSSYCVTGTLWSCCHVPTLPASYASPCKCRVSFTLHAAILKLRVSCLPKLRVCLTRGSRGQLMIDDRQHGPNDENQDQLQDAEGRVVVFLHDLITAHPLVLRSWRNQIFCHSPVSPIQSPSLSWIIIQGSINYPLTQPQQLLYLSSRFTWTTLSKEQHQAYRDQFAYQPWAGLLTLVIHSLTTARFTDVMKPWIHNPTMHVSS